MTNEAIQCYNFREEEVRERGLGPHPLGGNVMRGEHKEEQNRYTVAFFVLILILFASALAITLKSLIIWLYQ